MEKWAEVTGYEGLYKVSNLGRVYKITGKNIGIMRQHTINSGYKTVYLYKDRRSTTKLVHRLVAREFCEGYSEGLVVNHKDADRKNNLHSNLEWMTQKQNIQDSMTRGTHNYKAAHKVAHKRRRKPVEITCEETGISFKFESARKASKFIGVHENNVSRVARGVRPRTMGFRVKYL